MAVIGTPHITPSAADVLSGDRPDIIVPQFSVYYDETLHQKVRAAHVRQGVPATIQLQLYKAEGTPLSLTDLGFQSGSSSSESASSSEEGAGAYLEARIREYTGFERQNYTGSVSVYDADSGVVRVEVPSEVSNYPGIYVLEVGLFDENDRLTFVCPCYLFYEFSTWGDTTQPFGPPTLNDIRLSLRDSDIYENLLIDTHDFDIAEICHAAGRSVMFWNESLPIMSGLSYTTKTFPFREIWLKGIHFYLFQIAEEHYRRNKLKMSAGGTSLDDKNRDKEYKIAWQERYQEFQKMVQAQKVRLNMSRAWRTIRQW